MKLIHRIHIRIRIAYLIKRIRQEKNLGLFAAADRAQLSAVELLKYELGLKSPSLRTLAKIIEELKPSFYLYEFLLFPLRNNGWLSGKKSAKFKD